MDVFKKFNFQQFLPRPYNYVKNSQLPFLLLKELSRAPIYKQNLANEHLLLSVCSVACPRVRGSRQKLWFDRREGGGDRLRHRTRLGGWECRGKILK